MHYYLVLSQDQYKRNETRRNSTKTEIKTLVRVEQQEGEKGKRLPMLITYNMPENIPNVLYKLLY